MARNTFIKIFVYFLLFLHAGWSKNEKKQDLKKSESAQNKGESFQKPPRGITLAGKVSDPAVFYNHFVKASKPLWMRSVLEMINHPGLTDWTDDYLKKKYPHEPVKVETSKIEDRSKTPTWLTINQFLGYYASEDLYLVHSLDGKMADLILVPQNFHCGGFQKMIQEAVMWLGSGLTKSVLHYDQLDNFMCLLDGQKRVVLIDKAHKADVEADGFVEPGGYSIVDVDDIDKKKYYKLSNIEWYEVRLNKGDCLFIPRGWYHQVTSGGHRHLAVNLWFAHLHWFDLSNCSYHQNFYKDLEPISTFGFASPNELYRSKLLDKLVDKGFVTKDVLISSLITSTDARKSKFFDAIDKYKDGVLSWSELYGFEIDKAIIKFPDIFGLPGNVVDDSEEVVLYDSIVDEAPEGKEDEAEDDIVTGGSEASPDEPGVDLTHIKSPLPDDPVMGAKETKEDLVATDKVVEAETINDNIITSGKDNLEKKIEL